MPRPQRHLSLAARALLATAACQGPQPHAADQPAPSPARRSVDPAPTTELRLHAGYYDSAVLLPGAPLYLYARGEGPLELRARSFGLGELGLHLRARWVAPQQPWPAAVPPPTATIPLQRAADDRPIPIDLASCFASASAKSAGEPLLLTFHAPADHLAFAQIVQITDLGLTAALDARGGLVWVTHLATGQPLAGVDLTLRSQHDDTPRWSGRSDRDGLAVIDGVGLEGGLVLTASADHQIAYLPLHQDLLERYWGPGIATTADLRALITSDRARYAPGEALRLAGLLRRVERGPTGGLHHPQGAARASYTLHSPSGATLAAGPLALTAEGAFTLELPPPPVAEPGDHVFSIHITGAPDHPDDPPITFSHPLVIGPDSAHLAPASQTQPQPQPQPQPQTQPQTQPLQITATNPHTHQDQVAPFEAGQLASLLIRRDPSVSQGPAHGLLLLEREGILGHHLFQVDGDQARIELPIPASAPPNLHLSALLVHPGHPAFTVAALDLPISLEPKRIRLEVRPQPLGRTGPLRLEILATDAEGAPVPALLLLDLIDPTLPLPDPLAFFYSPSPSDVGLFDLRTYLLPPADAPLARPPTTTPEPLPVAPPTLTAAAPSPAPQPRHEPFYTLPERSRLRRTDASGALLVEIPRAATSTSRSPQRLRILALDPQRPDRLGVGEALLAPPAAQE
jgi:hypothetical protein